MDSITGRSYYLANVTCCEACIGQRFSLSVIQCISCATAAVQNPVLNSSRAVAPNSTQLITRWQRAYEL